MKPRMQNALAGTEETDSIDKAAANDKAIRLVFIGEVSLTLSLPTQREFKASYTAMSSEADT